MSQEDDLVMSPRMRAKLKGERVWYIVSDFDRSVHRGDAYTPKNLRSLSHEESKECRERILDKLRHQSKVPMK